MHWTTSEGKILIFKEVLYAPESWFKLITVENLSDSGIHTKFMPTMAYLWHQHKSDPHELIGIAVRFEKGLYQLSFLETHMRTILASLITSPNNDKGGIIKRAMLYGHITKNSPKVILELYPLQKQLQWPGKNASDILHTITSAIWSKMAKQKVWVQISKVPIPNVNPVFLAKSTGMIFQRKKTRVQLNEGRLYA